MSEPVSAVTTVGTWLAKKSSEEAWKLLIRHFTPDRLKQEIDTALKSNPAVAEAIQPLPTLDKARLTAERIKVLLHAAVTSDIPSLAAYLCNEQLVDLPTHPTTRPLSYDVVWTCIADAILKAILDAILHDDRLFRQFVLYSGQSVHLQQQEIRSALAALQEDLPCSVRDLASSAYDTRLKMSCSRIISEPCVIHNLNLQSPALLYGPPNVGKSCEAFRQAYLWETNRAKGAVAFFLNASQHGPEVVRRVIMGVDSACALLLVIDDAHLATDDMLHAYCNVFSDARSASPNVFLLWVSRDTTILNKLKPRPTVVEFSVDCLINRYLNATPQTSGLSCGHGVLAAMLAGLDPRLADFAARFSDEPQGNNAAMFKTIAAAVDDAVDAQASEQLRRLKSDLNSCPADIGAITDLYKVMLPAATLDCYLPRTFYIGELGLGSGEALDTLIRLNYATQMDLAHAPWSGRGVKLIEHPFQIRSLVDKVRFEEPALVGRIAGPNRAGPGVPLDAAVLSQFVLKAEDQDRALDRLKWLYRHAEWSGIPSSLLNALHFLHANVPKGNDSDALRFAVLRYLRKEERRVYKHDDPQVLSRLQSRLTEWLTLRQRAIESTERSAEGYRLDSISYEAGYLHYLLGDYDAAMELFGHSIHEALSAIDRAARADSHSVEWEAGKLALGHIWVAFTARLNCQLNQLLDKWGHATQRRAIVTSIRRLQAGAQRLLLALQKANAADARRSAEFYIAALRKLDARWTPVGSPDLFRRDGAPIEALQAMIDHQLSLEVTELVLSCIPVVVGLTGKRIAGDKSRSPQDPTWGHIEADGLRTSHGLIMKYFCQGLWDASEPDVNLRRGKLNALTSAALMMGHFESESIGLALLATMRCLDDDQTRAAVRWLLDKRCVATGPTRVVRKIAAKIYQ